MTTRIPPRSRGSASLAHSPHAPDTESLQGAIQAFRAELRRLWRRAGTPGYQEMAEATGLPAGRFQGPLAHERSLPTFDEVVAILRATGESHAEASWKQRWNRLHELKSLSSAATPNGPREPHLSGFGGTDLPESLYAAANATTPVEFNRALSQARLGAGLSLRQVADRSKGALSKSTVQRMECRPTLHPRRSTVQRYLRACAVPEEVIRLWMVQLEYLRSLTPKPAEQTEDGPGQAPETEPATHHAEPTAAPPPPRLPWRRMLVVAGSVAASSMTTMLSFTLASGEQMPAMLQWLTVFIAGASLTVAATLWLHYRNTVAHRNTATPHPEIFVHSIQNIRGSIEHPLQTHDDPRNGITRRAA